MNIQRTYVRLVFSVILALFPFLGNSISPVAAAAPTLSVTPGWTADGIQVHTHFGLVGMADVNGDSYADLVVGANLYDGGQTDEGAAYVYYGSPTGLSTTAGWMVEGDQNHAFFGNTVNTAGDVNGDGYDDVIIGAPNYDSGQTDEGRVFVYYGSAAGLSTTTDWTAEGNQVDAHFGGWVNTAGDVNGDGYDDVLIAAWGYDNDQADEGRVYLYYGSAAGLNVTAGWTTEGNQNNAYHLKAGPAGDVNGDGYEDVLIGVENYDGDQPDEGRASLYYGSASGLQVSPAWTAEGNQANAHFGSSTNTAGDVNNDGYADVVIAAISYSNGQTGEGRAFVYYGSATGLSTFANWTAETEQGGASVGEANTAGDVNGDGYADVAIGSPWYDGARGRAWVFHGSAAGLSTVADWTAQSDQSGAHYGWPLKAGDVNGDGASDLAVGAHAYPQLQRTGKAYVYYGGPILRIITESPLPNGTVGEVYSAALEAMGGTLPYTWSVVAGSLPPGLSLDAATGHISGVPTAAGTFGFTIQVTDNSSVSATKPFGLAPPPPSGNAGSEYALPINIDPAPESGGSDPGTCANYTVVAGALPDGLTLDSNTGVVSGTPTNGGTYNFTIGCTVSGGQNSGQTATKDFTITIYNPAPTITSLIPDSTVAGGVAFPLTVNGANFVLDSLVYWNGASRTTTYVSATQLRADILATDIAAVGTANITVINPEPGGGTSAPVPFTITPANQPPVANFTWSPETPDEGAPIQFTDLSTSNSGMIQSWHWDFAGLGSSSSQHPSFTFADNDLYNVCLTVTDAQGSGTPAYTVIEFERNAPFPGDDNTPWPRGDVTLGGVPFRIPQLDPSVWKSEDPFMTGPNPRTLDILVNQQGVDRVYTLINTGGGAPGPTAYAWLEFWGDGGAYHRKDLVGDVDIRDYNYDGWTNQINGTTTVNVFLHNPGVYNGERRLDMQIIDLPEAFLTQTLTHIRLSDNGGINLQRTILEGVAVQANTSTAGNTDTVCQDITINNVVPTANAGGDQTVFRNAVVTISGSWSDPAGALDNLYNWSWDLNGDGVIDENGTANYGDAIVRTTSFVVDGTAILTFAVTDKDGATHSDTIQITVINRAPLANDQTLSTVEDTPLPITLTGADDDNDTLTFSVLGLPSHGVLSAPSGHPAPSLTYTPDPDFFGIDSFTFKVNDGLADSNVATINITVNPVNDPPVALDDTTTTAEDTPVVIAVQANDSAGPNNEDPALTTTAVTDPPHGAAAINPDGSVTYTPDQDFSGTDSFGYTVCDNEGACASAAVTILVDMVNDPPVANDDRIDTPEDTPATSNVVANDSDVDGNLNPESVTILAAPANGALVDDGNGVFTYTPAPNFNGTDSFTYQICDSDNVCDNATVNITVAPVNDNPVCTNATPSAAVLWPPNHQFETVSISSITDVEGDAITIAITTIFQDEPTNGTGDGDTAPDGQGIGSTTAQVRAERKGDGNGRYYHISFTAGDGDGGACSGTVKVSVPKNMGQNGAAVDDGPLYDSTQP